MDKPEIKCSLKNISIPSEEFYRLNLIDKIEILVKRMRWREFCYLNQQKCDNNIKETFGLNQGRIDQPVPILFHSKKVYEIW